MTAPVPVPAPGAPVPAAPVPAPVTPAPADPNAPDPTAEAVAEVPGDGSDDQSVLARQMSARFSIVKKSGGEDSGAAGAESTPTPAAPSPVPVNQATPAPTQATLPSTSG